MSRVSQYKDKETTVQRTSYLGAVNRTRATFAVAPLAMVLAVGGLASNASAGQSFNEASVNIKGGNAATLSTCINYAKVLAKHNRPSQQNRCQNFAEATGGDVELQDVAVDILQSREGQGGSNKADVNISGGDADAVAACVNYLEGDATPAQKNKCKNDAKSYGGDVKLKDVEIVVTQL